MRSCCIVWCERSIVYSAVAHLLAKHVRADASIIFYHFATLQLGRVGLQTNCFPARIGVACFSLIDEVNVLCE